jgi:putative tryptophan/tyrosine transport system substrate-binding protein
VGLELSHPDVLGENFLDNLYRTEIKIRSMKAVLLLIAFTLGSNHFADAQQAKKIPRIGYVSNNDPFSPSALLNAFRQGLRDLGYIEGQTVLVEYRYAEGHADRIPNLVSELVQLKLDVLVIANLEGILTAKQATKTTPIVMVSSADPVASGIVTSLARPGGNITGLTTFSRVLSGKRLELLQETIPQLLRVAVLRNTASGQTTVIAFKEYEAAAHAVNLQLQPLDVRGPNPDLEGAVQAAAKGRGSALLTITGALLFRYQKRIAELAINNRLPSMFEGSTWVEAGGLMSYSTNEMDAFRRAATYVDKILIRSQACRSAR